MAHMVLAVLTFGIEAGFQNWCFGLAVCFFLPTFSKNNTKRVAQSVLYALAFIVAYFVLVFIIQIYDVRIIDPVSTRISNQLFIFNGTISFISIVAFTTLYSSSR